MEHSAILSTFIKLALVIKIFVLSIFEWPFYTGFTVYLFRNSTFLGQLLHYNCCKRYFYCFNLEDANDPYGHKWADASLTLKAPRKNTSENIVC